MVSLPALRWLALTTTIQLRFDGEITMKQTPDWNELATAPAAHAEIFREEMMYGTTFETEDEADNFIDENRDLLFGHQWSGKTEHGLAKDLRADLKREFPGAVKSVGVNGGGIRVMLYARDDGITDYVNQWMEDRQEPVVRAMSPREWRILKGYQQPTTHWIDEYYAGDERVKTLITVADEEPDEKKAMMIRDLVAVEDKLRWFRLKHHQDPCHSGRRLPRMVTVTTVYSEFDKLDRVPDEAKPGVAMSKAMRANDMFTDNVRVALGYYDELKASDAWMRWKGGNNSWEEVLRIMGVTEEAVEEYRIGYALLSDQGVTIPITGQ